MSSAIYGGLALIFVLQLSSCLARGEKPWNELIFTQQWAPAACLQVPLQKKHHCAIPANVTTWTIHGIWPTEGGSYGPNYCNKTDKFDPSKLAPIKDQLLKFWPNLLTDEAGDEFWEHEWTKHGTCAEELSSLNSELKYFSMGLKLNRLYDIQKILEKQRIAPSSVKTFKLEEIRTTLSDALGHPPKLQCFLSEDKSKQTLIQIEICLDKSFSVIECMKKDDPGYVPGQREHQRLRRSFSYIPAQTTTCVDNIPLVYAPFQR